MAEWAKWICAILTGMASCIPLAIKLIEAVRTAAKERNWQRVMSFVLERMKEAERKFSTGTERKEWVLTCVKASADTFNYDIDVQAVADMIDALTDMSRTVNASTSS